MAVVRSDIERALDELVSSEDGMRFQSLEWAAKIRKAHSLDVHIISREDIITSLMLPENASLCSSLLPCAPGLTWIMFEVDSRILAGILKSEKRRLLDTRLVRL